jgi:hypothetical protein
MARRVERRERRGVSGRGVKVLGVMDVGRAADVGGAMDAIGIEIVVVTESGVAARLRRRHGLKAALRIPRSTGALRR